MTQLVSELAASYSTRADDERRLEVAIARRNTAWSRYDAAAALLRAAEAAGRPEDVLRAYRRNYNETQEDWERAVYDLQRERRSFGIASSQHWKPGR